VPNPPAPWYRSRDALVLGSIAAGAVLALLASPSVGADGTTLGFLGLRLPTVCWMKRTLGLPCAGCGMTRSIVLIAHGRLAEALAIHPFGIAVWGLALLQTPPRLAGLAGLAGAWTRAWDRLWLALALGLLPPLLIWWLVRVGPALAGALA
jgi:hypothetical protein